MRDKYSAFAEFLTLCVIVFIFPYVLVWSAYMLSGFSFEPKEIFKGDMFYIISFLWWLFGTICAGMWVGELND